MLYCCGWVRQYATTLATRRPDYESPEEDPKGKPREYTMNPLSSPRITAGNASATGVWVTWL